MNVSVVMATYNGAQFLDAQLQSVFTQTLQPQEIIVCDDCSTDGTLAILKKYAAQGKLTYIVNEIQLGVVRNFKKATSLALAENFIAFCDQDDVWLPQKLERSTAALEAINKPDEPCISYSDLMLIDENDHIINQSFRSIFGHHKYLHTLETIIFVNAVTGCTILLNQTARLKFLEMPDDAPSHDEWLALVAFTFGKAVNIVEPLVKYRKHNNNVSIPEDFKPAGRFEKLKGQLMRALKDDDFLHSQFAVIHKFYNFYQSEIPAYKQKIFDEFFKIENKSYYIRKMSYRNAIKKYSL